MLNVLGLLAWDPSWFRARGAKKARRKTPRDCNLNDRNSPKGAPNFRELPFFNQDGLARDSRGCTARYPPRARPG